jgi:hypothetical protein
MNLRETGFEVVGWIGFDSGKRPMVGFCEHGNEHSSSIKGGSLLN